MRRLEAAQAAEASQRSAAQALSERLASEQSLAMTRAQQMLQLQEQVEAMNEQVRPGGRGGGVWVWVRGRGARGLGRCVFRRGACGCACVWGVGRSVGYACLLACTMCGQV